MTHVKKMRLLKSQGHPVECMVELEIDLDHLAAYLGTRALRNKSKRSHEVSGLVQVRVRPTSEE